MNNTINLAAPRQVNTIGCIMSFFILFIFPSFQLFAQPSLESFVTNTGGSGNATVNRPSGIMANDLLVVGLTVEKGSTEIITPPAGWTLIRRTNNSTDNGMATYYKIASGSEPGSYTFGLDEGSKWCIGISRISNVDVSNPIGVHAGSTSDGTNIVAPSITTTGDDRLVMCFYSNKKAATYSADGSTKEEYDDPNSSEGLPSNMMATFSQGTAGATGNRTATASEEEKGTGQQVAIVPAVPLPIELIDFQAKACDKKSVCLNWQTATEINNEFFTIERSTDGKNWKSILNQKGAGTSFVVQSYEAVDANPVPGQNLYRLKQTDYDGQFAYSAIKSVLLNQARKGQYSVFPNPTHGVIQLQGELEEEEPVRVFNLLGADVSTKARILDRSEWTISLDISAFPKGTYFLRTSDQVFTIIKE